MGARKKLALEQFNRDNILTAARELFETKGVQDTTMDDIALQADYSKSTIYVYFRSKEERRNPKPETEDIMQADAGIPEIATETETSVQNESEDTVETVETDEKETSIMPEESDSTENVVFASTDAVEDQKAMNTEIPAEQELEADTVAEKPVEAETPVESPKKQKKKHVRKQKKQPEAIAEPKTEAVNDDFTDSAFGPDIPEINISNEALAASVREAEAMGAAIMGDLKAAKVPVETMFGINEELSSYGSKKNKRAKSKVASDEDFYWYNKEDAADRPARRPIEAYYHHFNIADDCIEDLLVEMYDCALVRTEEIRYIAYGIEPRTLTSRSCFPTRTSPAGIVKSAAPTNCATVFIFRWYCASFSGISSTRV